MPQLIITTTELLSGSGLPTDTGTAFVAGLADAGPPPSGPSYVKCQSITDFTSAFGARSSTSAVLYDWLDEFFHDGGLVAYVCRVSGNTATSALLNLQDTGTKNSVLVTALTPGLGGNSNFLVVSTGTGPTFTANTSTSVNLAAVSSFANIGVGTLVTGAGIPANTYIATVNPGASTATLSQAATATATGVTLTPGTYTVKVQDSSANVLETHGPYFTTAQLFADATSSRVTFVQATAPTITTNIPQALTATALSGGANATGLVDADHVNALANFPPTLGPGTVSLPGKTSVTCWSGLAAHGSANNRWGVFDETDNTSAAANITAAQAWGVPGNASYGFIIQGSAILPGIVPGTTRTCPGSACVAALRAQVAETASQNQAPAGVEWGLSYPLGFTTFFGPVPPSVSTGGSFTQADVNSMSAAGVNVFANYFGVLCLFGFVSPIPKTTDPIYWQATAATERMSLVSEAGRAMAPYLFKTIDGQQSILTRLHGDLSAIIQNHWGNDALYGETAQDAGSVAVLPPVNTAATASAGQLNANMQVRISPFADSVSVSIEMVPITQAVTQTEAAA